MLKGAVVAMGREIQFCYDPLGRRIAKQFNGTVTRWLWDGNDPSHEWHYTGTYPPASTVGEDGTIAQDPEPVENLVTWVYEEGSFIPCAKVTAEDEYSVIADYLGTPTHAFNNKG